MQLYSCPLEHIYTIHLTYTPKCVPKAGANHPTPIFFFFFNHPCNISWPGYWFLSSEARNTSEREHDANSTMQMYSTLLNMYVTYSFLYAVMCIEYHRLKKKKSPLCFSCTVLGIGIGDSVSFLSSGSVLGLRVHNSVRYNYEKLIPGKPVWHFIHDVSYSDLIHSSLMVQPHTYKPTDTCSHSLFTPILSCTRTHQLVDSSISVVNVQGASCLRLTIVTDTCTQTNALAHPYSTHHTHTHKHRLMT